jgi:alkylated DNA nucleotide flippase Atl1
VGNIMREARHPGLPYHRVIAANGLLGGYGGNIGLKRSLLAAEGLIVSGTRVRHFAKVKWP